MQLQGWNLEWCTEAKKWDKRWSKEKNAKVELTSLLISAWSHKEKEGREHWRKRRQWVWSCFLSILLFSLPLSFSVTPSDLHPSLPFSSFMQLFFFSFFMGSRLSFPSPNVHQRPRKSMKNTKEIQTNFRFYADIKSDYQYNLSIPSQTCQHLFYVAVLQQVVQI